MTHKILEMLKPHWVKPNRITLEITEQSVMGMGQTTD